MKLQDDCYPTDFAAALSKGDVRTEHRDITPLIRTREGLAAEEATRANIARLSSDIHRGYIRAKETVAFLKRADERYAGELLRALETVPLFKDYLTRENEQKRYKNRCRRKKA